MVDFQSRDTDRGYDDADEEADDSDEEEPVDETDAPEAEADGVEAGDVSASSVDASDPSADGSADSGESDATDPGESAVSKSERSDPVAGSSSEDPLAPGSENQKGGDGADSPGGPDSEQTAQKDESMADSLDTPTVRSDDASERQRTGGETADTTESDESLEHGREAAADAQEPAHQRDPDHGHEQSHDHGHDQSHDHGHDHEQRHGHDHEQKHDHGHDHDHEQKHDHGHDHDHAHGVDVDLLGVAVVTVSSTRTRDDDASGDMIEAVIERADHEVVTREILRDDLDSVQNSLLNLTGRDDVDVVVTTGGTGVTPDDVTVEAARPLFDRELPGFGELFRILSYEEIGTRAMVSRATAGMVDGVPVFCLPGSEAAVRLGTEELIVEEMGHLVGLAQRDD